MPRAPRLLALQVTSFERILGANPGINVYDITKQCDGALVREGGGAGHMWLQGGRGPVRCAGDAPSSDERGGVLRCPEMSSGSVQLSVAWLWAWLFPATKKEAWLLHECSLEAGHAGLSPVQGLDGFCTTSTTYLPT